MDRREFFSKCGAAIVALYLPLSNNNEVIKIDENNYKVIVAKANHPNSNKRIYLDVLLKDLVEDNQHLVNNRSLLGELVLDNYENSNRDGIMFSGVSHCITDLSFEDNYLKANVEILKTSNGSLLKNLLEQDKVAFRLRGIGGCSVQDDGTAIIHEYKLITIDALNKDTACKL